MMANTTRRARDGEGDRSLDSTLSYSALQLVQVAHQFDLPSNSSILMASQVLFARAQGRIESPSLVSSSPLLIKNKEAN